jgi:hypothetical protein
MKTFAELQKEGRSTAALVRRRDERNDEGRLTKAQHEIQESCSSGLAAHCAYIDACTYFVKTGEMHPLDHPLASYYAELHRAQLLSAQHPSTMQHPLQR